MVIFNFGWIYFLMFAALYESLSIPAAVMTSIPLGVGGSVIFSYIFGLPNDVYFKLRY